MMVWTKGINIWMIKVKHPSQAMLFFVNPFPGCTVIMPLHVQYTILQLAGWTTGLWRKSRRSSGCHEVVWSAEKWAGNATDGEIKAVMHFTVYRNLSNGPAIIQCMCKLCTSKCTCSEIPWFDLFFGENMFNFLKTFVCFLWPLTYFYAMSTINQLQVITFYQTHLYYCFWKQVKHFIGLYIVENIKAAESVVIEQTACA